jgi:hypothetical protein
VVETFEGCINKSEGTIVLKWILREQVLKKWTELKLAKVMTQLRILVKAVAEFQIS